jgi:hypothetical protein
MRFDSLRQRHSKRNDSMPHGNRPVSDRIMVRLAAEVLAILASQANRKVNLGSIQTPRHPAKPFKNTV